jgi:hypothetical protein
VSGTDADHTVVGFDVHVIGGGVPDAVEEAAIVSAVKRVMAEREFGRSRPSALWGRVGRIEARSGLRIASRSVLPMDVNGPF